MFPSAETQFRKLRRYVTKCYDTGIPNFFAQMYFSCSENEIPRIEINIRAANAATLREALTSSIKSLSGQFIRLSTRLCSHLGSLPPSLSLSLKPFLSPLSPCGSRSRYGYRFPWNHATMNLPLTSLSFSSLLLVLLLLPLLSLSFALEL